MFILTIICFQINSIVILSSNPIKSVHFNDIDVIEFIDYFNSF